MMLKLFPVLGGVYLIFVRGIRKKLTFISIFVVSPLRIIIYLLIIYCSRGLFDALWYDEKCAKDRSAFFAEKLYYSMKVK